MEVPKAIRQWKSFTIFLNWKMKLGSAMKSFTKSYVRAFYPIAKMKHQVTDRTHNVVSMIISKSSFQTTEYLCLDCSGVGFYSLADKKQQSQERVNFLHVDTCRYTRRLQEILFKCTSGEELMVKSCHRSGTLAWQFVSVRKEDEVWVVS